MDSSHTVEDNVDGSIKITVSLNNGHSSDEYEPAVNVRRPVVSDNGRNRNLTFVMDKKKRDHTDTLTNSQMTLSNRQTDERPNVLLLTSDQTSPKEQESLLLNPPLKSRFNGGHFGKASQILRAIKFPHLKLQRPRFWTDEERILTYELIVAILKYASFLGDALDKSYFYHRFPETKEMGEEEVMVVLYDLLERGFRVSPDDSPLTDKFAEIQTAALASRTKIMAHMARLRIKHEANSIDHLLPLNLRHQHHIDKNPLYAWINLKKISPGEAISTLKHAGLELTEFEDDILIQEKLFCVDRHHPDLLRFHSKQADKIINLSLTQEGMLIIQDKSACIFVYALVKALFFKDTMNRNSALKHLNSHHMLDVQRSAAKTSSSMSAAPTIETSSSSNTTLVSDEWYDGILDGYGKHYVKPDCVVVTHCGSGRSAAHLACLLVEAVPKHISKPADMSTEGDLCKAIQSKFITRPPLIVTAFGVPENKKEEVTRAFRKHFNLTNFRLYSEEFTDISTNDMRVKGAAAILVNPPSSGSALKDPVAYVCSEGGDENVLTQLSKFVTSTMISDEGYRRYTQEQVNSLKHALSFNQVKLIMYTTCSTLRCENSDVIHSCLFDARAKEEARSVRILHDIVAQKLTRGFRSVFYEIVNLEHIMQGYPDSHFQEKFIEIPPSSASSGVFVALIRRRDRMVSFGRNPLRTFIASRLLIATRLSQLGVLDMNNVLSTRSNSSAASSNTSFPPGLVTEEKWTRYIADKYKVNVNSPDMDSSNDTFSRANSSFAGLSDGYRIGQRKLSKKAIVKRVSIPTCASLAKQKAKWTPKCSSPSNSKQGSKSKPTHMPSGRKPYGSNVPGGVSPSRGVSQEACVCSRHAKKFPEFTKSQSKLVITKVPEST